MIDATTNHIRGRLRSSLYRDEVVSRATGQAPFSSSQWTISPGEPIQDDTFEFELVDSYFVRINGTQYHFEDIQGIADTVTFEGGVGTDSATFFGTEADESSG